MPTNSFERELVPKKEKILDEENSQLIIQIASFSQGIQSDVNILKTEMDQAQTDINTLQSEMNQAQTDINALPTQSDVNAKAELQLPTWPTGITSMTIDAAWHDVDISGTYGAKKHLVFLYLYTVDTVYGQNVALRPKGSSSIYTFYTHTINGTQQKTVAVHTDSSGVWQYKALSGLDTASYAILAVLTP